MTLRLAHRLSKSRVNGPGVRFVVWVQGCTLRCSGCWNSGTWDPTVGIGVTADDLIQQILSTEGTEGVTFTGGEPFQQARVLADVAEAVQRAGLSVFVFTGYTLDEVKQKGADAQRLLQHTDTLVMGRYIQSLAIEDRPWLASSNQVIYHQTTRHAAESLVELCEMRIGPDGDITVTGFPSFALLSSLTRESSHA